MPANETLVGAGSQIVEPVEIQSHSLRRSGPYTFMGYSLITFKDTQNTRAVAQVNLPEHSDKWLLIFIMNPRHKDEPENHYKYLVYPFDDRTRNLRSKDLVVLNISGKKLDGRLGNKHVQLNAGQSICHTVQQSLPINLWSRNLNGTELLPALIKTYHFDPNRRHLMIFFPPVLSGAVDLDVRCLSDIAE
jgi:hypothetical protein